MAVAGAAVHSIALSLDSQGKLREGKAMHRQSSVVVDNIEQAIYLLDAGFPINLKLEGTNLAELRKAFQ